MQISFARFTQVTGAATALLAMTIHAQSVEFRTQNVESHPQGVEFSETNPLFEEQPAPVFSVVQPTVGETPFVRPVNFRGTPELRETEEKKREVYSERHWKLLLGVTVGGDYDDNIFLAPNGLPRQSDFIFAIAPTLGIQFGDPAFGINFLKLTYTPSFLLFADHSNQDAVDHTVALEFDRQTEIWTFARNFDFEALNGGNDPLQTASGGIASEQVGQRSSRDLYTLGLSYTYHLSDKTSYVVGLAGNYTHSQSYLSTANVVNTDYITYAISDRTTVGLGFGIGYANTQGNSNQIYEQALVSVHYNATSKLSFDLHGGAQFQQTGGGGADQVNGVYGGAVAYAYSDRTSFSLSAYRSVNPSSTEAGANFTATGVQVSASEKFLFGLTAELAVGYENSAYRTYTGPAPVSRTENYVYVQPSLQYPLGERASISLYYEYRKNNSTLGQDQFSDNRVGLKFSFAF